MQPMPGYVGGMLRGMLGYARVCWGMLGVCWGYVGDMGQCWTIVGLITNWDQFCPNLGTSLRHFGPSWITLGAGGVGRWRGGGDLLTANPRARNQFSCCFRYFRIFLISGVFGTFKCLDFQDPHDFSEFSGCRGISESPVLSRFSGFRDA